MLRILMDCIFAIYQTIPSQRRQYQGRCQLPTHARTCSGLFNAKLKGSWELQTHEQAVYDTLVYSCLTLKCQFKAQLESDNTTMTADTASNR